MAEMRTYPLNSTNNIIVKLYTYDEDGVSFWLDISDRIKQYSYECSFDNDIRQSASLTIQTFVGDPLNYMRRENKQNEWFEVIDGNVQKHSVSWTKCLYHLAKTYSCADDETADNPQTIDLGFFFPSSNDYSYNATDETVTLNLLGLSAILTKEYGGSVISFKVGKMIRNPETHQLEEKVLPTPLSIEKDVSIDSSLFYEVAMGSYAHEISIANITAKIPIAGTYIGLGQRIFNLPYTLDFDIDIGRMDMLKEITDLSFEGAMIWINEHRQLCISAKPSTKGSIVAKWDDYKFLFQSESISYDDSDYYNIVEVYGANNEYYGMCDESWADGDWASGVRKKIMQFDELQSNDECEQRAIWEAHKGRYGRMRISATLVDRYIKEFRNPSMKVGNLIEYATTDGDINIYNIEKISCDNETWTLELTLFRPLYPDTEIEDMIANSLKIPEFTSYEIIDGNIIRLHVKSEGVRTKIYTNTYDFIAVSDEGCDYVDIPVDSSGSYSFRAVAYSPYAEDSGFSDVYNASITIKVPAKLEDTDKYPHPDSDVFVPIEEHEPRLMSHRLQQITTDDGKYITIQ